MKEMVIHLASANSRRILKGTIRLIGLGARNVNVRNVEDGSHKEKNVTDLMAMAARVNIMRDAYAKKPRPAHKLKLLASPTDTGEPPARSATKTPATRNTITPLKRVGSQFTGALRRPHIYPIYL